MSITSWGEIDLMFLRFEPITEEQEAEVVFLMSLEDPFCEDTPGEEDFNLFQRWLRRKYPDLSRKYKVGILGGIRLQETRSSAKSE